MQVVRKQAFFADTPDATLYSDRARKFDGKKTMTNDVVYWGAHKGRLDTKIPFNDRYSIMEAEPR